MQILSSIALVVMGIAVLGTISVMLLPVAAGTISVMLLPVAAGTVSG